MKNYSNIGTQPRPEQRSTLRKERASKTQEDHDSRNFDISDSSYIDEERSEDNIYWTCFDNEDFQQTDFHKALLDAYETVYKDRLETINANYRADRHYDKQIDMETFLERNRPEAEILQIGNAEDGGTDINTLADCVEDYIEQQTEWADAHPIFKDEEARQNGEGMPPFIIVTSAGHADETTPHFQLMRIWLAYDENGDIVPNREKALEQCGVALPDPKFNLDKDGNIKYKKNRDGSFKLDKKGNKIPKPLVDRYNNRNMTFTAESREQWYDICEEHGFNIIREPLQPRNHKNKDKYIHEREKDYQERSKALDAQQKQQQQVAQRLLEAEIEQNQKDYAIESISFVLDERENMLNERENKLDDKEVEIAEKVMTAKDLRDDAVGYCKEAQKYANMGDNSRASLMAEFMQNCSMNGKSAYDVFCEREPQLKVARVKADYELQQSINKTMNSIKSINHDCDYER